MLGSWQLELSLQIGIAAVPVAIYFLVLGLVNSQHKPQMLSGRLDFALLITALAPLVIVPMLAWLGLSWSSVLGVLGGTIGLVLAAAPRPNCSWVIYNISQKNALRAIRRSLERTDIWFVQRGGVFELRGGCRLCVTSLPLLRNVTIKLVGPKADQGPALGDVARELNDRITRIEAVPSPLAVSFVLVSTTVIVAPLALMADRMPEMVRLVGELVR